MNTVSLLLLFSALAATASSDCYRRCMREACEDACSKERSQEHPEHCKACLEAYDDVCLRQCDQRPGGLDR